MAKRDAVYEEGLRKVGPDSAYARRLADMHAASSLVGYTGVERLAWVTRFAAESPSTWHSGDVQARGDCLLALCGYALPPNLLGGVELPAPVPRPTVLDTHQAVASFLREAVTVPAMKTVSVPDDAHVAAHLLRTTAVGVKPAVWAVRYSATSIKAGVLNAITDLVLQHGDRLVACRYCSDPVLSVKKRAFCTERCAQKFRNEKKAGRGHHAKTRKG
jgi:hypothetical protein